RGIGAKCRVSGAGDGIRDTGLGGRQLEWATPSRTGDRVQITESRLPKGDFEWRLLQGTDTQHGKPYDVSFLVHAFHHLIVLGGAGIARLVLESDFQEVG